MGGSVHGSGPRVCVCGGGGMALFNCWLGDRHTLEVCTAELQRVGFVRAAPLHVLVAPFPWLWLHLQRIAACALCDWAAAALQGPSVCGLCVCLRCRAVRQLG
jgi:hypothetical protein